MTEEEEGGERLRVSNVFNGTEMKRGVHAYVCVRVDSGHWLTMSKRCTSLEAKLTIFPMDSSPIVFRFNSKVFL